MSEMLEVATVEGQKLSAGDFHAKMSQWPENVRASLETVAACSFKWLESWRKHSLSTLSGRMFPDYSPVTEEATSAPSSGSWPTSGISGPGGCWTVNTSEWPNGGDESLVCSFEEVKDIDVPVRFYLSQRAIIGLNRRFKSLGRSIVVTDVSGEATSGRVKANSLEMPTATEE